jgi:hypothetical protein
MTPKEERAALAEQINRTTANVNALTAEMRTDRLASEAAAAEDGWTPGEAIRVRLRTAVIRGWARAEQRREDR